MAIPASPEQRERWAEGPVNPANDPNRRIGPAGKLLMAGAILTSLVIPSDRQVDEPYIPNPEPLPEFYCSDGAAQAEGQIDNWAHGGVERKWDDSLEKPSMVMSYSLQSGETLSEVAACYFQDVDEGIKQIAKDNDIEDVNLVKPGLLKIEITDPIEITLSDITGSVSDVAMQSGFTVEQLRAANGMDFDVQSYEKYDPKKGDTMRLPFQRSSAKPKPTTTTMLTPATTPNITTTTSEVPRAGENNRQEEMAAFIEKWGTYAEAVEQEFGINKNAVLAQAILESNYGSSLLATEASNLFGIKAHENAKHTPYWNGSKIPKETTEFLTDKMLEEPYWKSRLMYKVGKNEDGLNEVRVMGDFRKYSSFENSFRDYGYKITHEATYNEAAKNRHDPLKYFDEVAKKYASDPKYYDKVSGIFSVLESIDQLPPPKKPAPKTPKTSGKGEIITAQDIDFSGFPEQTRDVELKKTITLAVSNLSLEAFNTFRESGVLDKSDFVQGVMNKDGEYYKLLGRDRSEKLQFIVWHLWANGIASDDLDRISGTDTKSSKGNSHNVPLETQVHSWHNNYLKQVKEGKQGFSSAQYFNGDNGEVWQLAQKPLIHKALHAGAGIIDEGKDTFPGVNNENSLAIETQGDTIYDVSVIEFQNLIYLTADRLIEAKLITAEMSDTQIRKAVDGAIVGHGKNDSMFNNSGVEFGYKYRRPLVQAVQEMAVNYLAR